METRRETRGYAVWSGAIPTTLLGTLSDEADYLISKFSDGRRSADYRHFHRGDSGEPVLYRIHNLEKQGIGGHKPAARYWHPDALAGEALGGPARPTVCAMIVKIPQVAEKVPWHRNRTSVPPHTVYNLSLFLDRQRQETVR